MKKARGRIVIAGGTGHIGQTLIPRFLEDGFEVVVLTRRPDDFSAKAGLRFRVWDGRTVGAWRDELEGAAALINVAGVSVDCRYTDANRYRILTSRIASTMVLGEALREAAAPPPIWLQASTATIYEHTYGEPNDEYLGRIGGNEDLLPETWQFSYEVAKSWERIAESFDLPDVRLVKLRTSIAMMPIEDSALGILKKLTRFGLGGHVGTGDQYVSWVHDLDLYRAIRFIMQDADLTGAVNLAAPNPLSNRDFMKVMREQMGMPFGLPAPAWLVKLGSFFLRTESELVLKSRRVTPAKLLDHGFKFHFPDWRTAAADLLPRFNPQPKIQNLEYGKA